jgi:KDO2-lipid IV(A) lauroyltransferase
LACFLGALPDVIAFPLAGNIASFLGYINRRHYKVAEENLASAGINNIRPSAVFRHFAVAVWHLVKSNRRLRHSNFRRYFKFRNESVLQDALKAGRGVILVSGHFGNWELGFAALALAGYPINLVFFPQINPYFDDINFRYRTQFGTKTISAYGAISRCVEALNNKEIVIMLIDQTGREKGVMVDFFGRQAPAMWGPANLTLKTSAIIIPFACVSRSQKNLDYLLTFSNPIQYQPLGDKEKDIQAITQLYIKELEHLIRQYPEQWIWFHRRWKQYQKADLQINP